MESYVVVSVDLHIELGIEFPNHMIVEWMSIDQSFSGYIMYQFHTMWNILSWNTQDEQKI